MNFLKLSCILTALTFPSVVYAELKVVTTTPDLAALAKAVGADNVDVTALSLPTQDPHYVDAKPSLVLKVNRADILLAVGADLEIGWLGTLQTGARNANIIRGGKGFLECANHVELKEVQTGKVDRSMGDIHAQGNPHFLRSPKEVIQCASAITKLFANLDPANKSEYEKNFTQFEKQMRSAMPKWEARIKKFGKVKIVPYHASYIYFTDWLGIESVDHVEPKPGIPPSPAHVARLIERIQAEKVALIIEEEYHPRRGPSLIAERTSAQLVILPGSVRFNEGQTYVEFMEDTITKLERALEGARK